MTTEVMCGTREREKLAEKDKWKSRRRRQIEEQDKRKGKRS